MSTKKNILKNGVAAAIQKGLKVAEQLIMIPFFIQYWGPSYYGEWLTLTIIPATLALADFGFGTAAANGFVLKYAAGDKQAAANMAKTGNTVLSFLIISAIALAFIIVFALNYFGVFNKSLIPSNEAVIAVLILLIARIVNFYQALFEAYFRAARKANISIHFQSIAAILNITMGFTILLSGGRVIEYALSMLMVVILLNPLYIYTARRTLGLYRTHQGQIDKTLIKPLLQKGFGYFLSPIWQALYYQGMTFIVRITLGPIAVTIFNTVRTLIRSSSQAYAMSITAVYPDFQYEMAAGNLQKAKKIFSALLIANIATAIVFIFSLGIFGDILYNWWTKNALQVPTKIWWVFISGIFFYALWFTFSFVFEAINKPFTNTIAGLLSAILALSLAWLLNPSLGLMGSAVACLIFDILMCVYLLKTGKKTLDISLNELSSELLKKLQYPINKYFTKKTL